MCSCSMSLGERDVSLGLTMAFGYELIDAETFVGDGGVEKKRMEDPSLGPSQVILGPELLREVGTLYDSQRPCESS